MSSSGAGHTRDEKIRLSDGTIASEPQLMKIGGRPFIPGSEINHALDRFSEAIRQDSWHGPHMRS
jgi:cell filamentation protein